VREETPAEEAGLKKDDIILRINDEDLESLSQLVATVSESDGSPVKLTVLRAGDRQEISVTPRKMQVPTMVVPARMDAEDFDELLGNANPDVRVRRIHPGLLIEGGVPGEQKDVEALIEKLRQMAEKTAPSENHSSRIIIAAPDIGEEAADPTAASLETQAAIKQLQEQVRQLQEQLSELQKNVQSPESKNE
jgi:membrane-associated protease RseP (regulator of RpoE activity)